MQSSSLTKGSCSIRRQQGGLAVSITRVLCQRKGGSCSPVLANVLVIPFAKDLCRLVCKRYLHSSWKKIPAVYFRHSLQFRQEKILSVQPREVIADSKQSLQSIMCNRKVQSRQHNDLAVWITKCSCNLDIKRFLKSGQPKVLGVRLQIVLLVYIVRVLVIQIARVHTVYIVKDSCGLAMKRFLLSRQQKVVAVCMTNGPCSLDSKRLFKSREQKVLSVQISKCCNSLVCQMSLYFLMQKVLVIIVQTLKFWL